MSLIYFLDPKAFTTADLNTAVAVSAAGYPQFILEPDALSPTGGRDGDVAFVGIPSWIAALPPIAVGDTRYFLYHQRTLSTTPGTTWRTPYLLNSTNISAAEGAALQVTHNPSGAGSMNWQTKENNVYITRATFATQNFSLTQNHVFLIGVRFETTATGWVNVWVDGELMLSAQDIITVGPIVAPITVLWIEVGSQILNDVIAVWDDNDTGDGFYGPWPKDLRTVVLPPVADEEAEWEPVSGSDNYAMVASNDHDNYVFAETVGLQDTLSVDLSSVMTDILALKTNVRYTKDLLGTAFARLRAALGSGDVFVETDPLSVPNTTMRQTALMLTQNPDTGERWSNADGVQLRYRTVTLT